MHKHFCDCPVSDCPRHPQNHDKGCDPCIADNLAKKKMPACFFNTVDGDMSGITDYSIDSFVRYYLAHKNS